MVGTPASPPAEADPRGGGEGSLSGVGHLLRSARQRGLHDLPQVAEALRIREAYLEAIEAGRFGDLPGPAYAVGFVRSYAEFLQLDSQEIVRQFKAEMMSLPRSPDLVFPAPVPEGRVPGGAILLIAVMLAAAAYGGWYYLSATDRSIADLIPPLPDRFAALLQRQGGAGQPGAADAGPDGIGPGPGALGRTGAGQGVEMADPAESGDGSDLADPPTELVPAGPSGIALEPTVVAVAPVPAVPPALVIASLPSFGAGDAGTVPAVSVGATAPAAAPAVPVGPSSAAAALIAPAAPAPAPAGGGAGTASAAVPSQAAARTPPAPPPAAPAETTGRRFGTTGPSRILIRATGASWVQVRDGQGRLVMTRVLQPGDIYAVPDTPGLRLDTGNAGGLAIEVDGAAVSGVGSKGEVVRNIALDAGRLTAGGR